MAEYIQYIITMATTIWTMVMANIGEDEPRYVVLVFALTAVLIGLVFCFALVYKLFGFVIQMFRRGG